MAADPNSPHGAIHAVYFPSWKVYKGIAPSQVVDCGVTTVFYAFIIPNEDGTLRSLDEYADTQIPIDGELGCLGALRRLKEEHSSIAVLLSIGGGTGSSAFPALAATEDGRATFARCAREWVDRYQLDGIDIDWEHPKTPEEGRNYTRLMEACRAQLPRPWYLLTAALPVDPAVLGVLGLGYLCSSVLDYVNLMCYDFTGPWTSVAGHHAQLFSSQAEMDSLGWSQAKEKGARRTAVDADSLKELGHSTLSRIKSSLASVLLAKRRAPHQQPDLHDHPQLQTSGLSGIRYLVSKGVPKHKVLLGIPLYARVFPGAGRRGDGFDKGGEGEEGLVMDYCDMPCEWRDHARIDDARAAAWAVASDKGGGPPKFVSMEVPQTVAWKLAFARRFGLGGVVFWAFGGDRVKQVDCAEDSFTNEVVGLSITCSLPDAGPWD